MDFERHLIGSFENIQAFESFLIHKTSLPYSDV